MKSSDPLLITFTFYTNSESVNMDFINNKAKIKIVYNETDKCIYDLANSDIVYTNVFEWK